MNTSLPHRPLTAALLMVCAMAMIGVIDNFIVRLADQIGLWQFHFTRALMALPLIALMALLGLGGLRPYRFWAVALRSILVAISMLFYFTALAILPIAQALAGLFTSPIFILLITAILLRDPIGPWRIVAVMIGFIGILFVLQPDPNRFDGRILIPVCGGFFYALGAISTRRYCAGESTVAMLAGMMVALGLIGVVGLTVLAIWPQPGVPGPDGFVSRGWVWPMNAALPWVVVQAVGSVCGVFLIIKAYQLGEPSYVSVFEYSVMIFGPFFGWIAMGQPVGPMQMVGIALIFCAGIVLALRARHAEVSA